MTLSPFAGVPHPPHQQGCSTLALFHTTWDCPFPRANPLLLYVKETCLRPQHSEGTRLWRQWSGEVGALPSPKHHLPSHNSRSSTGVIITGMGDCLFGVFLRGLSGRFMVSFFCVPSNPKMILLCFLKKLGQHCRFAIFFVYWAAS